MPRTAYGTSLPTISSERASGVTLSCSSVPSSFSRTIAIDDRFVVTTSSSSARMPGIMKSRLSRPGLNQTRTSALTRGGTTCPPLDADSSRAYPTTSARA